MSMYELAILGGIWLSLIYAATVTPATVWVIQLAVNRGSGSGLVAALGMVLGQVPWSLLAGVLLFQFAGFWQSVDLWLRALSAALLLYLSLRSLRAKPVKGLRMEISGSRFGLFKASLWKSLLMPWRLPLWMGLIVSMSIHLRGPGAVLAIPFILGAILGQLAWYAHFILIAALFGNRVPDDISLHSMNKLRFLTTIVLGGLALLILAPLAFPFS